MSVAKIIPYPKFQDKDFYEKIYKKKEFYNIEIFKDVVDTL